MESPCAGLQLRVHRRLIPPSATRRYHSGTVIQVHRRPPSRTPSVRNNAFALYSEDSQVHYTTEARVPTMLDPVVTDGAVPVESDVSVEAPKNPGASEPGVGMALASDGVSDVGEPTWLSPSGRHRRSAYVCRRAEQVLSDALAARLRVGRGVIDPEPPGRAGQCRRSSTSSSASRSVDGYRFTFHRLAALRTPSAVGVSRSQATWRCRRQRAAQPPRSAIYPTTSCALAPTAPRPSLHPPFSSS